MGRAVALALVAATQTAVARPITFEVGGGDGIGYASRAGVYRDDGGVSLRFGIALNCRVVLDIGATEDTARIEPGLHTGVRIRLLEPQVPSLYLRGDVGLIAASRIGSNYDLAVGAGVRHRVSPHIAGYVEVDTIARVGEVETLSVRIEFGLAIASLRFWR